MDPEAGKTPKLRKVKPPDLTYRRSAEPPLKALLFLCTNVTSAILHSGGGLYGHLAVVAAVQGPSGPDGAGGAGPARGGAGKGTRHGVPGAKRLFSKLDSLL